MAIVLHRIRPNEEVVQVEDGGSTYFDTVANFALDNGSAFPSLLAGSYGREYSPGVRHFTKLTAGGTEDQGLPWTDGDTIISNLSTIVAAKDARLADPIPTLDEYKTQAKLDVDNAAELARRRYVTRGSAQAMVYLRKETEAEAYKTAGYPTVGSPNEYPHLSAEAASTSQTEQQVADLVIATRDAWITISAQVEGERMGGKKNVDDAADETGVNTARDNAITALDAI